MSAGQQAPLQLQSACGRSRTTAQKFTSLRAAVCLLQNEGEARLAMQTAARAVVVAALSAVLSRAARGAVPMLMTALTCCSLPLLCSAQLWICRHQPLAQHPRQAAVRSKQACMRCWCTSRQASSFARAWVLCCMPLQAACSRLCCSKPSRGWARGSARRAASLATSRRRKTRWCRR